MGLNYLASENLCGLVHFEGHLPEWRVLSKFSVQPCNGTAVFLSPAIETICRETFHGCFSFCVFLLVVVMYTQAMGSKEWREVSMHPLLVYKLNPFWNKNSLDCKI